MSENRGLTMREILFRGKWKSSGEWVYGNLFNPDKADTPTQICIGTYIARTCYEIDPETVCQFTGLYDKNGRKIFEGDIVEGNSEYFTYTHPYGKVVYDGGQYLISFDDVLEDIECLGAWANDVEIIGNIYDNPEMLEGS